MGCESERKAKGGAGSPRFYKGASPPLIEDIRGNELCKKPETLINKGFKALFVTQPIYHSMIH